MFYPNNFEQKIGFDKIRLLIKQQCISVQGAEKTDAMQFSVNYDSVQQQLSETQELLRVLTEEEDAFPLNTFYDLREGLARIKVQGLFLDASELFDLRRSLEVINEVVRYIADKEENKYPCLQLLITDIAVFPAVVQRIEAIINKFGKIKDNASPELAQIRKEIVRVQGSVSKTLNSILRQAQADGLVEKDMQPTLREGRLVIPVSPAYKRKIKGIVHDESATGKTVFIEPAEVVEANNRLRELESEERREIMRILLAFADFLRPYLEDILNSYSFLATIDFIRAKALFALQIKAIKPIVLNECIIEWERAVHPLLYLSLQKQEKEIVPLNITLNQHQRILLISGPNAGGKSVCLKTVGLLQYMVQCGLLVPLHETTHMGIFGRIFVDIGDEQSIENDLSTYSSHLTNMKYFVKNSQSQTLLLIDEFGGGTEPQIGGAIAEALLQQFNQNKAFGIITTHYTNLKHFAEDAEGIVNGAMLYDRHHMQPLFQLEIGHPGSSFAIEIARKIGLPESVIKSATDKVGADHIDYDKHLQDIVRDKRYWENKRQQIHQQEKRIAELEHKYEAELGQFESQRKELLKKAKEEASNILAKANAKIENTIREIKEAQADKEKTRIVREHLDTFKKELQTTISDDDAITRKMQQLQERQARKQQKKSDAPTVVDLKPEPVNAPIKVGDMVRVKGSNTLGEVLELTQKQAILALGGIKTTVKLDALEKTSKSQLKKQSKVYIPSTIRDEVKKKKLHFSAEIDVRGLRADEAVQTVSIFIDDALVVGAERVRILHGTGTGALRQVIRQYLATLSAVKSAKDEHVQLGGAGITVVEFDN
ncbi:MAG: Smr/MutS family protein [Paludibacteraceae bacterium]|nr:Smr/MutS family protein [Paludibacteraceae bacterium]